MQKDEYLRVNDYLQVVGANIKRLRIKSGISQADLAKKAKVGLSSVKSIEQGKAISLINLIKIAEALGVEPPDLFISEKDREEITYKHKLLMEKISEKELKK